MRRRLAKLLGAPRRAEFFTPKDRLFATIDELQEALDAWVVEYNTTRPHQSCGGRAACQPGTGPA